MFDAEQKAALAADLSKQVVKTRKQSGRTLSYIEGWQVIAEANRIFGFDGWTRETITLTCVTEKAREIGEQKVPGWGVTYIAKVRVVVGDIVREGCGTGHGIDRDVGQAHESALKEAETDAMKRALMTFGNPFGLALYDKEQTHVSNAAQRPTRAAGANDTGASPAAPASSSDAPPLEVGADPLQQIKEALQLAATHGIDAFKTEWTSVHPRYQRELQAEKERLKPIAVEADLNRARA